MLLTADACSESHMAYVGTVYALTRSVKCLGDDTYRDYCGLEGPTKP